MKRVHILGSLNYHDDTILGPIINELEDRGAYVCVRDAWTFPQGANVHVADLTQETLEYWSGFELPSSVEDGDVILVADFWNPNIFNLRFAAARRGLDLTWCTIHHGSSHLPGDFASEAKFNWVQPFESAWITVYDMIFFGSKTTMKRVYSAEDVMQHKHRCHYLPTEWIKDVAMVAASTGVVRHPTNVIMPLRMDADKGADDFFTIVRTHPEFVFHCTGFNQGVDTPSLGNLVIHPPMNRHDLAQLMRRCNFVLSCAKQETFGYGVLEALYNGCIPVLMRNEDNCYEEMYKADHLFDDASTLSLADCADLGRTPREVLIVDVENATSNIVDDLLR